MRLKIEVYYNTPKGRESVYSDTLNSDSVFGAIKIVRDSLLRDKVRKVGYITHTSAEQID